MNIQVTQKPENFIQVTQKPENFSECKRIMLKNTFGT